MDQSVFVMNESKIKEMLRRLSDKYLFEDVGYTLKNSYNWGIREAKLTDDEMSDYGDLQEYVYDICIADYGYLFPLYNQKEELLRCPICTHKLKWNDTYTALNCINMGVGASGRCQYTTTPFDLRERMNLAFEEMEDRIMSSLTTLVMPDLTTVEQYNTQIL